MTAAGDAPSPGSRRYTSAGQPTIYLRRTVGLAPLCKGGCHRQVTEGLCKLAPPARIFPQKRAGRLDCRRVFYLSTILPSVEIVCTCHGINFPLFLSAIFAATSIPEQHGTSIRTIVTLFISFPLKIAVSFSE